MVNKKEVKSMKERMEYSKAKEIVEGMRESILGGMKEVGLKSRRDA